MRIEQQGYTTIQPSYQHVGYTSAAAEAAGFPLGAPMDRAAVGGSLALLAVALWLASAKRLGGWRLLAVVPLILVCAILWTAHTYASKGHTVSPPALENLQRIERGAALADEWIARHGVPPSSEEWLALAQAEGCATDVRGRPLEYSLLDRPSAVDGQRYSVACLFVDEWPARRLGETGYYFEVITSSAFGRDGLFGTADDAHHLRAGMDWQARGGYQHGRAARTGGVSP